MSEETITALQEAAASGIAHWGFTGAAVQHVQAEGEHRITVLAFRPTGEGPCNFTVKWSEAEELPGVSQFGEQFNMIARRFLYGDDPVEDNSNA